MIKEIPLPTVEQVEALMQSAGFDTRRVTIEVSRCADTGHPIVSITPITVLHEIDVTISVTGDGT